MTLYNPFSAKIEVFDPFGILSLEGMPDTPFPEGINDFVRAPAAASGAKLADVYPELRGTNRLDRTGDQPPAAVLSPPA